MIVLDPVCHLMSSSQILNHRHLLAAGNLRHLIVEACIARNLLDTSAYFWPGYVNGRINQMPHNVSGQVLGWSTLMKGAQLIPSMINALATTPASRYADTQVIVMHLKYFGCIRL